MSLGLSTQKFAALVVGCLIAAALAGLDAFRFHVLAPFPYFDEALMGSSVISLGVHWLWPPTPGTVAGVKE